MIKVKVGEVNDGYDGEKKEYEDEG